MPAPESDTVNPKPGYVLSLIAGLALAAIALKMFRFPSATLEPSFINCFNYIDPVKGEAMFWAALILSAATIWLSFKQRAATIVFIEAIIIWTVAYFLLLGVSPAPVAMSPSGVMQSLVLWGASCVGVLMCVRWTLQRTRGKDE